MPNNNAQLEKRLDVLEEELKQIRMQLRKGDASTVVAPSHSSQKQEPTPQISKKSKPKRNIEDFLGRNLIGKLGAFALILTSAWFVKHAVDMNWLNASVRIFLGLVTGFLMVGASLYFAKKHYKFLWPATAGAGYAIVSISIYASYYFYDFLGISESFVYLFALSFLVVLWAMHADNQALYIFSLLGVFLIPIMHSQGQNSYRFLFSYITIVHLIYAYTAVKNAWRVSGYILWTLLALFSSIWAAEKLEESSGLTVLLFLGVNALILLVRQLFILPQVKKSAHIADPILAFFVGLFVFGLGVAVMNVHYIEWRSLWILVMILYAGSALVIIERRLPQESLMPIRPRSAWSSWALILICSLSLAGLFEIFDANWWVAGILGFSCIWLLLSARLEIISMNIAGLFFWMLTAILLLFAVKISSLSIAFLNQRFLLYVIATAALASSWFLWKSPGNFKLRAFWPFSAISLIIFATCIEFYDIIDDSGMRNLVYSLVLMFYAALFLIPGFVKNLKYVRYAGLAVVCTLVFKFYFYDIWQMKTSMRILIGLSSGIVLMLFSFLYQRFFPSQEVQK